MSIESARAAINAALTRALEGETAKVSPAEHGVSASDLSEIANEEVTKRDAVAKHDINFVTESREEDGSLLFRPVRP